METTVLKTYRADGDDQSFAYYQQPDEWNETSVQLLGLEIEADEGCTVTSFQFSYRNIQIRMDDMRTFQPIIGEKAEQLLSLFNEPVILNKQVVYGFMCSVTYSYRSHDDAAKVTLHWVPVEDPPSDGGFFLVDNRLAFSVAPQEVFNRHGRYTVFYACNEDEEVHLQKDEDDRDVNVSVQKFDEDFHRVDITGIGWSLRVASEASVMCALMMRVI